MELSCDLSIALGYVSPAQRARVISEHWFSQNCYCLACDSDSLSRTAPNTKALDFSCNLCGQKYELKTFRRRPRKSLVDGAYDSLIGRVYDGSVPTLCLLGRTDSWQIDSLTAIHSSFLTPSVIERRPALRDSARRAGWVGCNIRLDRIPPDGEIDLIRGGICLPKRDVRSDFKRFLPLAQLEVEQRDWTRLTLSIIRQLGMSRFKLSDLYRREAQFAKEYPKNSHIRAKIRQQLQVLRNLGAVRFEGHGLYSMMD
jgi:type II restriction enzyme